MEIILKEKIKEAVKILFNSDIKYDLIQVQETRKDFKGDFTLVVFPLLRFSKSTPEQTGEMIGNFLVKNFPSVAGFNVIKGFLNLEISSGWWIEHFRNVASESDHLAASRVKTPETVLVEYSSPNTNKPLHLGHIRNNLLGYSLYRLLSGVGHNVIKTNIVNDRGIHICKSMLAWQKFGNGETPESSGMKGDHLVGKYYVIFEKECKLQIESFINSEMDEGEAKNSAALMKETREMLLKWEAGDKDVVALWKMRNGWGDAGFDVTYRKLVVN